MLSGVHQSSYATNSAPQNFVLLRCRSLLERAVAMQLAQFRELRNIKTENCSEQEGRNAFRIADMGCSSGPNCLFSMQFMLDALAKHHVPDNSNCFQAIQTFFCDLPSNDFNTLFQLHHAHFPPSTRDGPFPAAVAGTFYGRLFPASSLHIVFSSTCLHWLSQVPASVMKPDTREWNKGKIWVDGPEANEAAGKAYAHQWQQDLQEFLKSRSVEMVSGGLMFLLIPCRPDTFPSHQMLEESCFRCVEQAWQQLVQEGVLEQSDIDGFNIPVYLPSLKEITAVANAVPELKVQGLEVIEEDIGDKYWRQWSHDPTEFATRAEHFYRSGFWNVTVKHVGTTKCEAIFGRLRELLKSGLERLPCWTSSWAYPFTSCAVIHMLKET